MSKKRQAGKLLQRRPRSWLGIASLVLSLAALAFTTFETDAEGRLTNPGQIFASFADLNLGVDKVAAMRGSPLPPASKPASAKWRRIVSVLDGDTVRLDGGQVVRLIGVDTPESSENRKLREDVYKLGGTVKEGDLALLGKAAAAFTRALAEGRSCWLEFEKNREDQYGRLLAYVHLDDGLILNEAILESGYGKVYLGYSFSYRKRYVLLQSGAQARKAGLWSAER